MKWIIIICVCKLRSLPCLCPKSWWSNGSTGSSHTVGHSSSSIKTLSLENPHTKCFSQNWLMWSVIRLRKTLCELSAVDAHCSPTMHCTGKMKGMLTAGKHWNIFSVKQLKKDLWKQKVLYLQKAVKLNWQWHVSAWRTSDVVHIYHFLLVEKIKKNNHAKNIGFRYFNHTGNIHLVYYVQRFIIKLHF